MDVLAISGSLRRDSHNAQLLRAAALVLPSGVRLVPWNGLREIPPYDADTDHAPPRAVLRLRAAITGADALLVATPEYNHSIPGQLKNAIDWLSRPLATSPLRAKPVAVVGASTGMFGAVWAQAELRKVLAATGAAVVDRELPVPNADEAFGPDGRLLEPELRLELESILGDLIGARQLAAA
jgi:chromate reductase, NAD(P)H dehydrogenase (quinone)